jgi:hypothetical protein
MPSVDAWGIRSNSTHDAVHVTGEIRPIFIVGCGRSGTTLLYEMLARHRDLAWFSTWTDRSRRPELAVFNRLFKQGRHSIRYGPRPSEGYRLWDAALALPPLLAAGSLGPEQATPDVAGRVAVLIDRHRRFGAGRVFLNKNTRNSRRVLFLRALYPNARFIHVLRFPLDTVASVLEAEWWGELPLWWRDGATPRSLRDGPLDEVLLAAELWVKEVSAVLDASDRLAADQYAEIRYEDLVSSPTEIVTKLLDWLDLGQSPEAIDALVPEVSTASIGIHKRRLSPDQARIASAPVVELAARVDYQL